MSDYNIVSISTMTGKLKGFRGICFNPLTTDFCNKMKTCAGTICESCYSAKMLATFRKSCGKRFSVNAELMKTPLVPQTTPQFMPGEYVRFLPHGEIDTPEQYLNFVRIAEHNPESHFSLWTKRTDIVSEHFKFIPNLKLIQSSYYVGCPDERAVGFDAVFTVYSKENMTMGLTPKDSFICKGKSCRDCMFCYKTPYGHITEELR